MLKQLKVRVLAFLMALCLTVPTVSYIQSDTFVVEAKTRKVYIAASGRGKCYHKSKYCSRMRGRTIKLSKSKARRRGYRACKKCYR